MNMIFNSEYDYIYKYQIPICANDKKYSKNSSDVNEEKVLNHKRRNSSHQNYESQRIEIPDIGDESVVFSFRKLWVFMGPGFLMSIAYLDPGNIESDLQSGAIAGYKLLWVLLSAHILGLMLQRLAARIGVVSGKHMAEIAHEYYKRTPRLILWIMVEIAIVGSDMQEVIGTAIAFYLLSNALIPLWAGVLITIVDTFTFLFLDKYGFRKLEAFFGLLITTMAVTFGIEFFAGEQSYGDLFRGMFVPGCSHCNRDAVLQAVGIIGAVIMPHNLYLHSALVKTRCIDRTNRRSISEANKYFFIESSIALFVSFVINTLVVAVFAEGMYGKTNADVYNMCMKSDIPIIIENLNKTFPDNDNNINSDIYDAGIFLGCQFGAYAMYVWGVGILAAGQSSTMTGTYAGQFAMEGFIKLNIAPWKRVLFTRSIAIAPTLCLAIFTDINDLTSLNDILNTVNAIQLPFALIPCLTFACSDRVMHDFKLGPVLRAILSICSMGAIAINLFFTYDYIAPLVDAWWGYVILSIIALLYLLFIIYLGFFFICELIPSMSFHINSDIEIDAPWLTGKNGINVDESHDNASISNENNQRSF